MSWKKIRNAKYKVIYQNMRNPEETLELLQHAPYGGGKDRWYITRVVEFKKAKRIGGIPRFTDSGRVKYVDSSMQRREITSIGSESNKLKAILIAKEYMRLH